MPFPVLAVIAAAQLVAGAIKSSKAAGDQKRLAASRKPFETTDQIFDIQNATENRAQQGYDPTTLNYLTNQIDRAASGAYGTAKRLGANPNDLSAIFDQQMQATMKVGANNAALNMENFSKYLGAQELLSKNLEAEWASKQGMIKDELQAAQQRRMEGAAQISNGINTGIAAYAGYRTEQLYTDRTNALGGAGNQVVQSDYSLPSIPAYNPSAISSSSYATPMNATIPATQSVSAIVTPPVASNFYGSRRAIGIDENGNLIYGTR